MRTFLVFAIIGLYIAVAFVPPSTQNLQAAMLQLGDAKLFTGFSVGSVDLQGKNVDLAATAKTLGELASRITSSQPTYVAGLPAKEYADKLADAADVLASVAGKSKEELTVDLRNDLAKKAAEALQNMANGKPAGSAAWKKMLKAETDPVVLEQLHIIQDAILSGDVRVCGGLPYVSPAERTVDGAFRFTPSHGDYLAYCLARVTGESGRCLQIDERVFPDLRAACGADFGTDV